MSSNPHNAETSHTASGDHGSVVMPAPTIAPLVLAAGLTVLAAGIAFGIVFVIVGAVILVIGLGLWIAHLLPGRGHEEQALAAPTERAAPVVARPGMVEVLKEGAPGYRFRLPEKVHPISAGIKGGIVGGLLMPLPALAWGVLSGHTIWYPVNLLAGMVIPGMSELSVEELQHFRPTLFIAALLIHAVVTVIVGLIYGVLLPTLPQIHSAFAWGGLLMPILWTVLSFVTMGVTNPLLSVRVDWPWFIASQFVFGVVAALVVHANERRSPIAAGAIGGIVGGLLMPIPALLWALATGHTLFYPVNLLSAMFFPEMRQLPHEQLEAFRPDWLLIAIGIHAVISVLFGLVYGALLPRVRPIPGPLAWGGLVLPLVWTGMSYGLMGIVNPLLQERVDWPWFIASQFVFGLAASIVVVRSEMVHIPPAGTGVDAGEAAEDWVKE